MEVATRLVVDTVMAEVAEVVAEVAEVATRLVVVEDLARVEAGWSWFRSRSNIHLMVLRKHAGVVQ